MAKKHSTGKGTIKRVGGPVFVSGWNLETVEKLETYIDNAKDALSQLDKLGLDINKAVETAATEALTLALEGEGTGVYPKAFQSRSKDKPGDLEFVFEIGLNSHDHHPAFEFSLRDALRYYIESCENGAPGARRDMLSVVSGLRGLADELEKIARSR